MASAAVLQIEQTIVKLPSTDQEFLYRRLERVLKLASSHKRGSDFRKKRFATDLKCPRCGNSRIHRHGKYKGWHRYKCLSCKKTFNDATASPMAGTHYNLQRWLKYAECMSQGMSVRRTAQEVGISVPTSFYWRHKILTALRNLPKPSLTGIVEADETFFLESDKGHANDGAIGSHANPATGVLRHRSEASATTRSVCSSPATGKQRQFLRSVVAGM